MKWFTFRETSLSPEKVMEMQVNDEHNVYKWNFVYVKAVKICCTGGEHCMVFWSCRQFWWKILWRTVLSRHYSKGKIPCSNQISDLLVQITSLYWISLR
jgi:hypothetical protein